METTTERVKTASERYTYTPKTRVDRRKIRQKGMSTENNIGVQTRAMAQWVDNEENPEQVQKAMDQPQLLQLNYIGPRRTPLRNLYDNMVPSASTGMYQTFATLE